MDSQDIKMIAHELKFWRDFVKSDRFLKGWVAKVKTPELNHVAHSFIYNSVPAQAKILDVGSGVVSILNGAIPGAQITAADPLGELYECIFDYKAHKLNPCIPIRGEELAYEQSFDLVHMSNAIDHSSHPWKVMNRLINACKVGGHIMIQGFENEGQHEKYNGMHKWDITLERGELNCAAEHAPGSGLTFPFRGSIETVMAEKVTLDNRKVWYIYAAKVLRNATAY